MHARVFLLLLMASLAAASQPCTKASVECTERIALGPAGKFSVVYRNFSLTERNTAIERALVIIHGAGRNADAYFQSGLAGAFLAQALASTLIVAPRFASQQGACRDQLAEGEISWKCSGADDWRGGGGPSDGAGGVTSFDLVDKIVEALARRDVFPNLKVIVITGHSAGGQFTHRYAAANRAEAAVSIPVRYLVANPSSYLYLDALRLAPGATCSEKGGCTGPFTAYREGRNCTTFNAWRYGMEKRTGYAAKISDEQLREQLTRRDVTYLLGEFDNLPVYGFDSSCPAMAQGSNRLERGVIYWNYINSQYKARHKLVVVPACGHNGRCMYTAAESLPLLFP